MATYPKRILSVCSGIAGLDLGVKLATGAETICYVEREAYSAATLVARMEEQVLAQAPIWDDLTTFDGKPWRGKVDCIIAGFPCPPVSVAGKRKGAEDDRWLWNEISRIINEVKPKFVFLENVPGLLSGQGQRYGCLCGRPDRWGRVYNNKREKPEGWLCGLWGYSIRRDGYKSFIHTKQTLLSLWGEYSNKQTRWREYIWDSEMDCEWGEIGLRIKDVNESFEFEKTTSPNNSQTLLECFGETSERRHQMDTTAGEIVFGCEEGNNDSERKRVNPNEERRVCLACGESLDEENRKSLRGTMGDVLWSMAESGYDAEWGCFSAKQCGFSHKRERLFILGRLANTISQRPGRRSEGFERSEIQGCGRTENKAKRSSEQLGNTEHDGSYRAQNQSWVRETVCHDEEGQNKASESSGTNISREFSNPKYDRTYFLPGPNDGRGWEDCRRSDETLEPALCRKADGIPDWMVEAYEYRPDRIRALGNGVIALVGAFAFSILFERMIEDGRI